MEGATEYLTPPVSTGPYYPLLTINFICQLIGYPLAFIVFLALKSSCWYSMTSDRIAPSSLVSDCLNPQW